MRIIAGGFYDIQKGLEKAAELEKNLLEEFGDKLDLIWKNEAMIRYERQLENWERRQRYDETHIVNPVQEKIARMEMARKVILFLAILGAISSVLAVPALLVVSTMEAPTSMLGLINWQNAQSVLLGLLCKSPLFLVGFPIVMLVLSFSISANKRRLPKPSPKPEFSLEQSSADKDELSQMVKLTGELVCRLKRVQNPLLDNNNYGLQGEERLVQHLGMMLNDDYICIRGALVDHKLDADVLLVGPSGIWVLESKYIKGRIFKDWHGWHRVKEYHVRGGYLNTENTLLDDIEEQWTREKEAVERALRSQGLHPIQAPASVVKGGVVFTHPDSKIVLHEPASIEVGLLDYWCELISREATSSALADQQVHDVVSAILEHARKLNPNSRPAVDVAEEIYLYKRKWLDQRSGHSRPVKMNETAYSGVN